MSYDLSDAVRVSVCMAAYNGEAHIEAQLQSILSQLPGDGEVVISDDCSQDGTVDVIEKIKDRRIRLVRQPVNIGVVANFEASLRQARGRYVFLADQDDIWEKEKISEMCRYLKTYDLVVCDCRLIDDAGKVVGDSYYRFRHSGIGLIKNLLQNSYMGCCMALRREILELALPFPKQTFMHDWWLGLVAEVFGQPFFLDRQLVLYRRHAENKTSVTGLRTRRDQVQWTLFRIMAALRLIRMKMAGALQRTGRKERS